MNVTRLNNNSDTFLEKGQVSENLNKKSEQLPTICYLLSFWKNTNIIIQMV